MGRRSFCAIRCSRCANVEGRLHVARKPRHHDEWDLPIAPYDPTGRASMSSLMTESVIDQAGPALHVTADRDRAVWGTKSVDDSVSGDGGAVSADADSQVLTPVTSPI
jgi:hypothetical protein